MMTNLTWFLTFEYRMSVGGWAALPPIPKGTLTNLFEKEVFYTLNFLRTQPGLMRQRLKRVK